MAHQELGTTVSIDYVTAYYIVWSTRKMLLKKQKDYHELHTFQLPWPQRSHNIALNISSHKLSWHEHPEITNTHVPLLCFTSTVFSMQLDNV